MSLSGHNSCFAQVKRSSSSGFATGRQLRPATRFSLKRKAPHATVAGTATGATKEYADRFRLNNLSPQKGARRQEKRKGRGYGSGQVGAHHAATAHHYMQPLQLTTALLLRREEPVVLE